MAKMEKQYVLQYMFGGFATIGFHSIKTGKTIWFRIRESKRHKNVFFLYESYYGSPCLGRITDRQKITVMENLTDSQLKMVDNFLFVWDLLHHNKDNPNIEYYHKGLCGVCGRDLKDIESINRGIGPTCWKKINL